MRPGPVRGECFASNADSLDDSLLDAIGKAAGSESSLDPVTDCLPRGVADTRVNASIGNDLDGAIGQQHVQQHAVVGLGVPDPQQAEYLERTRARPQSPLDSYERQCRLDRKADLPGMLLLTFRDGPLDAFEIVAREMAVNVTPISDEMPPESDHRPGHYQSPEAPPPPNPPPPPEKPPPPPPPPRIRHRRPPE